MSDQYLFRRQLVDALQRDLLGPADPHEVLTDPPITRYLTGILYPNDAGSVDSDQDDTLGDDDDAEGLGADPPVTMAHVRYPSSMGMTFAVDLRTSSTVTIKVEAARYHKVPIDSEPTEEGKVPGNRAAGRSLSSARWQRKPVLCAPVPVDVARGVPSTTHSVAPGLELYVKVRAADDKGSVSVTVVLINRLAARRGELRDELSFFQSSIRVTSGTGSAFIDRHASSTINDPDLQSNKLLYRHTAAFAIGHGCSVGWEADAATPTRARNVFTSFIPTQDVLVADSNANVPSAGLRLSRLSSGDRVRTLADLSELCRGYETWIREREDEARSWSSELRGIAERHLAGCTEALDRMQSGIELLESDNFVWQAFQLANNALLQVRARTRWKERGRTGTILADQDAHAWRPFQLAFILQCLAGLSDSESADRQLADLLWFPTGGGKTEAYLALIAYIVFLRRLRNPTKGGGVTAIMRYTLRLLTIQQFERAALLICSCEALRLTTPGLGDDIISIGLWVGQSGSPNTLKQARIALDKLRQGHAVSLDEGNPMQLQACPWCGEPLETKHYYIGDADPRLIVACRTPDCQFRNGLPVHIVDEDIYRFRPTLLVATADKFASLPWRETVATLFGDDPSRGAPPELIVQDELHLISGPLGTLAGLYETAVDSLCSKTGTKPKVIASTATIRRAGPQTTSLFDREVRQFPPPGLDARDSYFAVQAHPDVKPSRLYVGLMAPGSSQTTLLVRTYAALLQGASALPGSDVVRDPYWTLIGYFNSLRVLGGARMQVQDDVNDRIALLAQEAQTPKRSIENRIELTSREPSGDIPSHLGRMAIPCSSPDALDVILATNMISVGVDVDRLGLMVVMGQPPSTSEYIQATSRIGRRFPGLNVILYNASRSRDRSHYEQFPDYHGALYRQVESTSVTPFSARSRDRGLHAVFVALARLMVPELASRDAAGNIVEAKDRLVPIKQIILDRIRRIAPGEVEAAAKQLDEIESDWVQRARDIPGLVFDDWQRPERALLVDAARGRDADGGLPTLWSLRDVDVSCYLYLIR